MSKLADLVSHIPLPRMVEARQNFPREKINDVPGELRNRLEQAGVRSRIKPGAEIAITAGSRGIDNIALIIRETAQYVKELGADPFIIPAWEATEAQLPKADGNSKLSGHYGGILRLPHSRIHGHRTSGKYG